MPAGYVRRPSRIFGVCDGAQRRPVGTGRITPSQSSQKEDVMDRTSPEILAFVALIGGLLLWVM